MDIDREVLDRVAATSREKVGEYHFCSKILGRVTREGEKDDEDDDAKGDEKPKEPPATLLQQRLADMKRRITARNSTRNVNESKVNITIIR